MNKTEKKKIYTYYISNVMGDENKTNKYLVEIKFPVVLVYQVQCIWYHETN